jgi:hypothetical protein
LQTGLLIGSPHLVVAELQQPQRFANDFTSGMVQAATDLLVDERFELCRQRHVHETVTFGRNYQELSVIVKDCYPAVVPHVRWVLRD